MGASPIRWGYSLACFHPVHDNPKRAFTDQLKLIREAGCDGYQFDLPLDIEKDWRALTRITADHGLSCLVANDWNQDLERFPGYLDTAAKLGALVYNHHLPMSLNHDLSRAAEIACRFHDQCAEAGITYSVELHRASLTQSIDKAFELVLRFPELKFTGDFSHYVILSEPDWRFEPFFSRLAAIHLRAANENCVQPEIVEGRTVGLDRYENMLRRIFKTGFSGPVIAEMIPYYSQFPRYDLHASNVRLLNLAKHWAGVDTQA